MEMDKTHSSFAKTVTAEHANFLYGTTAKDIGSKAAYVKPERPVLHGFSGRFSTVSL